MNVRIDFEVRLTAQYKRFPSNRITKDVQKRLEAVLLKEIGTDYCIEVRHDSTWQEEEPKRTKLG